MKCGAVLNFEVIIVIFLLLFYTLIYSRLRLKIIGLKYEKPSRKKVKFLVCIEVSIPRNFKQKDRMMKQSFG